MAALTQFTDGLANYGSMDLSIGTFTAGGSPSISSGVTYVADSLSISRPSSVVEQTDKLNKPSGQKLVDGFVTGSAQLQLASGSTLAPLLYKAFTISVWDTDNDGDVDPEYFVINDVGQPYDKAGETKVNIGFRKIINTASAVAA